MARTSLTTQNITRAGTTPSLTGPPNVDGDIIDVGATFLQVVNGGAGATVVTVQTPPQVDGLDVAELTVSVPAGATRYIGPFPPQTFGQQGGADAGRAYVNYSVQTSVTRGVFKVV